jgi:hypothetical protein
MSITHAAAFRRRAGAATIVAFFCVLLASTLIEPTGSHTNRDQLRAATLHSGAMQAASWCAILAGVLAPVVVLTLMHVVRGRGVVLAHVAGILGILGSVSGALIGLHGLFIVALAGRSDATAVLDRLNHIAPAITVLFFVLPVALTMLAIAAVRGGFAPRWVIPVAVLFLLAEFAPLPGSEIVQMALGLAAFGRIARSILGMSDAEWESASLAGAPSSGRPAAAPVG